MAGDWIKMRTNLDTDPRVIELASLLELSELHIVGLLWRVWSWADSHSLDGNAIRVTGVTLDRFTGVTGFADALRKVGWLEGRDGALTFPRFAEHNGQTAKKRAETKERVAKHRNAKSVTDVTQKALPEKRRVEKSFRERERLREDFRTDEFCEAWDRWCSWVESQTGKPVQEQQEMVWLMDLEGRGVEKAIRDIDYTIGCSVHHMIYDHTRPQRNQQARNPKKRLTL